MTFLLYLSGTIVVFAAYILVALFTCMYAEEVFGISAALSAKIGLLWPVSLPVTLIVWYQRVIKKQRGELK